MWHYNVFFFDCFHIITFVVNIGTCTQQIISMCSDHRELESSRGYNMAERKLPFMVKYKKITAVCKSHVSNVINLKSDFK